MIKLLSVLLLIGAFSACASGPDAAAIAADEARLKADSLAWFDFYNKGDADAVANLYAEDALLMPPNAPTATGRAGIRAFIMTDAAASKAAGLTLKNASVTGLGIHGDSGWLSGTFSVVDAEGKTVDTGKYLSVHRRTKDAWLYVRDTWNVDAPPAPPEPAPKKGKLAPIKRVFGR